MTIATERLALEPVTPLNAGVLWRLMGSGGLREFQDVPRYTRSEFEKRVASRPRSFDGRATGRFEWLIVHAATRQPMGWISLRVGDAMRRAAEVGYSVLAAYRRHGYASEAARGIVAFAFRESALERIDACCVPQNIASQRLLEGIGFDRVRVQKNGAIVRGRPVDILVYELSRSLWYAIERSAEIATPRRQIRS